MTPRTRLIVGVSFAAWFQAGHAHGQDDAQMCISVCTLPPMTITAGEGTGRSAPRSADPAPSPRPRAEGGAFTQTGMDTLTIGLGDPLTREAMALGARDAVQDRPLAAYVSRPETAPARRGPEAREVALAPRSALDGAGLDRLEPARLAPAALPVHEPVNPDPGAVYVPATRNPLVAVSRSSEHIQRLRRMSDDARTAALAGPMNHARRGLDQAWGFEPDGPVPEPERPDDDTVFFGLR